MDQESDETEKWRQYLLNDQIGKDNAAEYYRDLDDAFRSAAEWAKMTIEEAESAEEEGEEFDEGRLSAAKFFERKFGFINNVVAVYAFEDYRDEFNVANFDSETYANYVEAIESLKNDLQNVTEMLDSLKEESDTVYAQLMSVEDDRAQAMDAKAEAEANGDAEGVAEAEATIKAAEEEIASLKASIEELSAKSKKYKEELMNLTDRLSKWACMDEVVGEYVVCETGYVQYTMDEESEETEKWRAYLLNEQIGKDNAGGYYRDLDDAFRTTAEWAKMTIEEGELAAEDGKEFDEGRLSAAKWFVDQFGTINNVVAVYAFEDYRDSFESANFDSETYADYVESLQSNEENLAEREDHLKSVEENLQVTEDEKAAAQAAVEEAEVKLTEAEAGGDATEIEEAQANLKAAKASFNEKEASVSKLTSEVKMIKEEIKKLTEFPQRYGCIDETSGEVIPCQSGYVAYAIDEHDDEEKDERNARRLELGFSPDEFISGLENTKQDLEADIKRAKTILEEGGSDQDMEWADAFIANFGETVSVVALASYSLYKAELKVEENLNRLSNTIASFGHDIINEVNNGLTNTTIEVVDVKSQPDGNTNTFEAAPVSPVIATILMVAINGVNQKPGVDFTTNGLEVTFDETPELGDEISIVVVGHENGDITSPVFNHIPRGFGITEQVSRCDELMELFENNERDYIIANNRVKAATKLIEDLTQTVNQLTKSLLDVDKSVEERKTTISELNADSAKISADLEAVGAELDKATTELNEKETSLSESERNLSELNESVDRGHDTIAKATQDLDEEQSKPYPNEELVDELEQLIDITKKQIEEFKADSEKLSAEIEQLSVDIDNLRGDIDGLQSNESELSDKLNGVESQISIVTGEVTIFGYDKSQYESSLETFQNTIDKAEDDKAQAETVIAQTKEKRESIMDEMKESGCQDGMA